MAGYGIWHPQRTVSKTPRRFRFVSAVVPFCRAVAPRALALLFLIALMPNGMVPVSAPEVESGLAFADTSQDRQQLEEKLTELEQQIVDYEQNITTIQGQKKTLANEVKILDSQMNKLTLQVKALDLEIQRLNLRISDLGLSIKGSGSKIDRARDLLNGSVQSLYELSRVSLIEILAGRSSIGDFVSDLNSQNSIQDQLGRELSEIRSLKVSLETQQTDLVSQREDQAALLALQENQRQQVLATKSEKDQLLRLTKGKESLYQELVKQSQKTAAQIRAQLFELIGGGEIKFEDALRYAEFAAQETGVRSALLLAVLDKESALGKNVGRCSWDKAMHPTRDKPAFVQITGELGLNPDTLPVSCPILSDGSYGGAMGIAQFLPSTWMLYRDRIKTITGSVPSPWNPRDAFVATALYLADAGAAKGGTSNERIAAARYYAGSRWRYYLYSYGDRVLERARYYQDQINVLAA